MSTEKNYPNIELFDQLLTLMRTTLGDTAPMSLAQTFLKVCLQEGMSPQELTEKVNSQKSTMSRHLLDLSERLRNGAPGRGLLQRNPSPDNLRSVNYTLANKGKMLRNTIDAMVEERKEK